MPCARLPKPPPGLGDPVVRELAVPALPEYLEHVRHAIDVANARAPAMPVDDDGPLERTRVARPELCHPRCTLGLSWRGRRQERRVGRVGDIREDGAELVRRGGGLDDLEVELERGCPRGGGGIRGGEGLAEHGEGLDGGGRCGVVAEGRGGGGGVSTCPRG